MAYAGDEEKIVLETAAEMDGKLALETTVEMDGKPDTWTSQIMYKQQGPQTTQMMEAVSWTGDCRYSFIPNFVNFWQEMRPCVSKYEPDLYYSMSRSFITWSS